MIRNEEIRSSRTRAAGTLLTNLLLKKPNNTIWAFHPGASGVGF